MWPKYAKYIFWTHLDGVCWQISVHVYFGIMWLRILFIVVLGRFPLVLGRTLMIFSGHISVYVYFGIMSRCIWFIVVVGLFSLVFFWFGWSFLWRGWWFCKSRSGFEYFILWHGHEFCKQIYLGICFFLLLWYFLEFE